MEGAPYDLESFIARPSWESVDVFRKVDWIALAQHYEISLPSHASKIPKVTIKAQVIRYLVDNGLLESRTDPVTPSPALVKTPSTTNLPDTSDTDEEPPSEPLSSKPKSQNPQDQSFELEKLKLELQFRKMEMEERRMEREFELKKKELDINSKNKDKELQIQEKEVAFNYANVSALVPNFEESDIDGSFRMFERIAVKQGWPKKEYMSIVGPKLSGKSLQVYANLDHPEDYDFAKTQILNAHAVTPENYRQKFRNLVKSKTQSYVEFAMEKLRYYNKWLNAVNVTTFSELVNLMVLEEWKNKLPFPLLRYVEEKDERELVKVAEMADAHALRLDSWNVRGGKRSDFVKSSSGDSPSKPDGQKSDNAFSKMLCSYCKKPGHSIATCKHPNCQFSKKLYGTSKSGTSNFPSKPVATNVGDPKKSSNLFKEFTFEGLVSLGKEGPTHSVKVLRDTAASQSILVHDALPGISRKFTGENVLVSDLTSTFNIPLAEVYLECPLIKSLVKVAVKKGKLPLPGVHLLLGNDLVGSLVVPNVITVDKPLNKNAHDTTNPAPSCVVTRSQAKQDSCKSPSKVLSMPPLDVHEKLLQQPLTKEALITAQNEDPSLAVVRQVALDQSELDTLPAFYHSDGVLMRAYRPPYLAKTDSWSETHQVVLPSSVRQSVLKLTHDGYGGHLGRKKTYQKLLSHFYWPGMKKDVNNFVKTCHPCQLVGNRSVTPAPLHSIPVIHEPFEKVILDCVGPLPPTKKGNQYLLTVMDSATRYPEAFPLKNITTKSILKPLLHMFTSKGIPKQIQTDQGTNFTSKVFQQVLKELGVEHITSSAYHPQSQGCLERFHQTLKQVLRKYCLENSAAWDEGIDWLLFAYRESIQESLGFSPFEILYGRPIRGPLKVLKDQWFSSPTNTVTVQQYLSDLMKKLKNVRVCYRKPSN